MHAASIPSGMGARCSNAAAVPTAAAKCARRPSVAARSAATDSSSATELKMVGPAPQKFAVAEGQLQNIASAAFAAVARLGCGALCAGYSVSLVRVTPATADAYSVLPPVLGFRFRESSAVANFNRPAEPLTIYDKQDCPASRKVREAVSILDLDALFLPCPEGGPTWGPELRSRFSSQAPFLVDPNTGFELGDGDEIVDYLFRTYGNRQIPLGMRPGALGELTAKAGLAPRKGAGGTFSGAAGARLPEQPLEFWAYEASPFCVVVREVLSELEIPHVQRSAARGSPKRQQLLDRRGAFQVPYLEDPNTGVAMFESAAIIDYLRKTYGRA